MAETMAAIFASTAPEAGAAAAGAAAGSSAAASAFALSDAVYAGSTIAAGSGGGLFAALEGVSASTWLSAGATAIGALSSIGAGNLQSTALKEQQMQSDLQSRQALLEGRRQSLESLISLNETMARNQVAGAASGIVTSEGSVRAAQEGAQRKANFEIGMARDNAEINAAQRMAQGRQYGLEAAAARTGGYGKAAGLLAQTAYSYSRRG